MKLMALRLMLFAFAYAPLRAIAQEVQVPITPPAYYGSGPWHMWTYGGAWHFWLMIPMMIFFFLLLCAVMLSFVRGAFGHWGSPFYGGPGHMPDRFSGDASRSNAADPELPPKAT